MDLTGSLICTSHTHTHTHARTHTHTHTHTHTRTKGTKTIIDKLETRGLEIVFEQVSFQGSFERRSRYVAECLSQNVDNRWETVRKKKSVTNVCVRVYVCVCSPVG